MVWKMRSKENLWKSCLFFSYYSCSIRRKIHVLSPPSLLFPGVGWFFLGRGGLVMVKSGNIEASLTSSYNILIRQNVLVLYMLFLKLYLNGEKGIIRPLPLGLQYCKLIKKLQFIFKSQLKILLPSLQ